MLPGMLQRITQVWKANHPMSEVNHPDHYNWHPTGIEAVDVSEEFSANLGQVIQYIWRCGYKHSDPIPDLEKAAWFLQREIGRLSKQTAFAAAPSPEEPLIERIENLSALSDTYQHKLSIANIVIDKLQADNARLLKAKKKPKASPKVRKTRASRQKR